MATLIPALDSLRAEFNRRFPGRDKASDGWIGDADHSANDSDHNPDSRGLVHAIDVDEDLRDPYRRTTMRDCVDKIVADHKAGRDNRLTYIIYERAIWSASRGWESRAYTGSNPHDKHAHFSARRWPAITSRERDTSSWGIVNLEVPTVTAPTPTQNADAVWSKTTTIPGTSDVRTVLDLLRYLHSASRIGEIVDALIGDEAIQGDVTELRAAVAELKTLGETIEGRVETVSDRLNAIMSDPHDYPPNGNPEEHPFVMAFRYVQANPTAGAGQ
jgi:hypothetical protein